MKPFVYPSKASLLKQNPLIQKFKSFDKADNDAINERLVEKPLQSICYTHINKMSEEFTEHLDAIFFVYMSLKEQGIDNRI